MGINDEREVEANLQIGPTDAGMVRLFVEGRGIEVPMDFEPDEADEIADENPRRRRPGPERAPLIRGGDRSPAPSGPPRSARSPAPASCAVPGPASPPARGARSRRPRHPRG